MADRADAVGGRIGAAAVAEGMNECEIAATAQDVSTRLGARATAEPGAAGALA